MTSTLYVAAGQDVSGSTLHTADPDGMGGFILSASIGTITDGAAHGRVVSGADGAIAFSPISGLLYGVTSVEDNFAPNQLLRIDETDASAVLIGDLNIAGDVGFDELLDMDFAADGTLYASVYDDTNFETILISIDLATGAATVVGSFGLPETVGFVGYCATAFRAGTLYVGFNPHGVPPGPTLASVNTGTGAATLLFNPMTNSSSGTDVQTAWSTSPDDGLVYGLEETAVNDHEILVNVDTGAGVITGVSFNRNAVVGPRKLAWTPLVAPAVTAAAEINIRVRLH